MIRASTSPARCAVRMDRAAWISVSPSLCSHLINTELSISNLVTDGNPVRCG